MRILTAALLAERGIVPPASAPSIITINEDVDIGKNPDSKSIIPIPDIPGAKDKKESTLVVEEDSKKRNRDKESRSVLNVYCGVQNEDAATIRSWVKHICVGVKHPLTYLTITPSTTQVPPIR